MTVGFVRLGEVLMRLDNEISRIEGMARKVELAFSEISKCKGDMIRHELNSLQNLDLLIQTTEDLQRFVKALSLKEGTAFKLDISDYLATLHLGQTKKNLSGQLLNVAGEDEDVMFFYGARF